MFHVFNRAIEGVVLFENRADFEQFYRLLVEGRRRFGVRFVAYCLMRNHWHLVLWPTTDKAVSDFLHWLETKHSLHFRWLTGTAGHGHVYQSRFQCFVVQTERYYFNLVRYVEANPLEAHLVDRAEDWAWSSLFERLHEGELIEPGPLPLPVDWVEYVNAKLSAADLEAIECCERSGRPYGDRAWVGATAALQSLEQTTRPRGRPRRRAVGAAPRRLPWSRGK